MTEFREFQKIPRLFRDVIVTEKIDGTNACVVIYEEQGGLIVKAQSRSKFITPQDDNYGFAKWVGTNADELRKLGPGYHYGEWWGQGIQRSYGMETKRFSLFNVSRWSDPVARPLCCSVVPVLATGIGFSHVYIALDMLKQDGSKAAPGFRKPEGVIAFHAQGNLLFKATLEKDEEWKGKSK